MKNKLAIAAAMVLSLGSVANASGAAPAGGSLAVTGGVDASIAMIFHQHILGGVGIQIDTGDGTAIATSSLTTVSKYGTPDGQIQTGGNFTKSTQSDGFTLSGTVDIQVYKANNSSSSYTLNAQLQTADTLQWKLNGASVVQGSNTQLTALGSFGGSRFPTAIAIKIPNTNSAGSIVNTIVFTVTSN